MEARVSMPRDLRFAVRMLLKEPGFTLIAVLTLALGIGANTAIFSVINAALLRPLPFENTEQLVLLHEKRSHQATRSLVSPGDFFAWQELNSVFSQMSAYTDAQLNLTGDGEPERIWGMITTSNFFETLGVEPALGRVFTEEDGAAGVPGGVIISHGLWQRRFGSAQDVLGKTIRLDGVSYNVVGVMPREFQFLDKKFELWRSLNASAQVRVNRSFYYLTAVARLKTGVSLEQAVAEMEMIGGRLEEQFPQTNSGHGVSLTTLSDEVVGRFRASLLVLLGAVAMLLLIACANVASLSLARGSVRRREMAVRAALGATRAIITRQLLTESMLLAIIGGVVGLLLAVWGIDLLAAFASTSQQHLDQVTIDGGVLAFTLVVSMVTGVACGLIPALQASKCDLSTALKENSTNSTGGPRRTRARNLLVVSEVTLALVLLVGAGLLLKSFARLLEVESGFASENILAIDISLNGVRFANRRHTFMEQLLQRVEGLSGVEAAGGTTHLPFSGEEGGRSFSIIGEAARPGERPRTEYRVVTPDYLRTLKIPLRSGRFFTRHDQSEYLTAQGERRAGFANLSNRERNASGVLMVNETFARTFFPNENPLGRRIVIDDGSGREREIVGVVGDIKHFGLDQAAKPELYVPYSQSPLPNQTLVVRSRDDPMALVSAIRDEVRALDSELPLYGIRTIEDYIDDSIANRRLVMVLMGFFAGVALLLSAVGIYGVISQSVMQRTREVGIRMALGAQKGDVLRLIVTQGMGLALTGIAIGLIVSFALTRLMESLLFGVSTTDPVVFATIVALLMLAAVLACYIPARRAVKVDPLVALRCE